MNRGNYIATAVAGVALAFSTAAQAESWFSFEAGIGASRYNDTDGLWVNKGLPHNSHLTAPAYRVGIQFNAINHQPGSYVPGLAMHLAYMNFGRATIRSLAAPDGGESGYYGPNGHDGWYSPTAHSCVGPCGPMRNFVSGGTMQAVALTFEPFWTYRKWRFGVEAGPAIFRATYDATATAISDSQWWHAGQTETFHHMPKWEAGAVVGASVGYGPVSLRYNYIFSKTHTYSDANVPPAWSGAHMLTLNYTF